MIVYTGSVIWESPPEIRGSKKGRAEYGPGIYFTTRRQTAAKYAGGQRAVLRVELAPITGWLEGAVVPMDVLTTWVMHRKRLRGKTELLKDLQERAGRGLAPGLARAEALVNLMVNSDAITGEHGPALAELLVSLGIQASHVEHSGEDWVVLFDPSRVLSWRRADDSDPWDQPRISR